MGFYLGYTLLDGFDLGIGMMFTFFPRNAKDRFTIFNKIWPFWDGNEVWLIMGTGTLFAIFPLVYGTILSHFYLLILVFVFAIIFRAVSFEFWPKESRPGRKKMWETVLVVCSFIMAFLFWLVAGNILMGIPAAGTPKAPDYFWDIFSPVPLVLAVTGMNLFLMHGFAYTIDSTSGKLKTAAIRMAIRYWYVYVAFYILFMIFILIYNPHAAGLFYFWIGAAVYLVAIVLQKIFLSLANSFWFFWASASGIIGTWVVIGSIHFPVMIKQTGQAERNLTVYDSSNTLTVLILMAFMAGLGMLIVIGYTIYVYRVLRGKLKT